MRLTKKAQQITTEFWLVTLTLTEENKMPNIREFVVNEHQLAFLNLLCDAWKP
jgi:hypothetical protein